MYQSTHDRTGLGPCGTSGKKLHLSYTLRKSFLHTPRSIIVIICLGDYFLTLQMRKKVEVKYSFKTEELVTSLKLKTNFCLRPALIYA